MTAMTPNTNAHESLGALAASRHSARSPNGCVTLSSFLKPNKFFDPP